MPARTIKKPTGPGGRRPGAGRPRDPESILGLRRRKLALEVEALEIDLAVKRKTKIDTDKAASVVAAAFAACKSRLLALPPKLAPLVAAMVDAEEVRGVLADAVEEALAELTADAEALGA
jgi:hypothetical protein